ncbi:hypothetical protein L208DRAFT_1312759, partial [Tricholoma matsutake]
YFTNKSIMANDQVSKIIYNFEATSVQSWVTANEDRLLLLTFKEFMAEFRGKFLVRSWEDELVQDQIAMQGNTVFLTWISKVHNANDELAAQGSGYYITPANLCRHLIPCFNPALKRLYNGNNGIPAGATTGILDAIKDLEEWMERVRHLEDDLNLQCNQWVIEAAKSMRTATTAAVPATTAGATTVKSFTSTTNTMPLPRLMEEEKNLLLIHRGCYKCRIFYAGHMLRECPIARATLDACKGVTIENATRAKAAFERSTSSAAAGAPTTTHVTAVFGDSDNEDYFQDILSEGEGNECVSSILGLPHHLKWTCCIDAPLTCGPTPIDALIDHGCPPVLISTELVEILGLVPKKLFKVMSVSGAFTKNQRKPDSMLLLSHYCRLHIQSPDAIWKSRIVNAIICPQLHMDLILGLDFLVRNHIVVDVKERTAIAKDMSYDLLNPLDPCTLRKMTLTFDFSKETCCGPDIVGLVRTRIEQLATLVELQHLDVEFKKKYQDLFPTDIPHMKDLPHDIYHNIELLPGALVSVAQAYGCPQKYRPGWKTLIEQHLAGQIQGIEQMVGR